MRSTMHFDTRDVRLHMDVYTMDNALLGEVRKITPKPELLVEEHVGEAARQSSTISGELLGPMPTEPIGNPAPRAQSAREMYGAQSDHAQQIGHGTITVGKGWGLIKRRTIPMDLVQTVSLERVVLKLKKDELTAVDGKVEPFVWHT